MELISVKHPNLENFPSVFYIGLGKTASSSVLHGFPDHSTAHWHGAEYFQRLHGSKSLSGYQDNLYDFIFSNCIKNKIKPLIIEHIRDPIARSISLEFQLNGKLTYNEAINLLSSDDYINKLCNHSVDHEPYSRHLIPKYLNELKKYQENKHGKFVILKFESDLKDRKAFFKSIGYNFKDTHPNNKSNNRHYKKVCQNFKLKEDILTKIYKNNKFIQAFYDDEEINNFITKWRR